MKASDRQVGGEHYKSGFQHWDYCGIVNVPNLEYASTKYIIRWRKKNGIIDLQKARHYIEKRIELFYSYTGVLKGANKKPELFNRMCKENGSSAEEIFLMDEIMHWKRPDQLINVLAMLDSYIAQEERKLKKKEDEACEPNSAYVNQD